MTVHDFLYLILIVSNNILSSISVEGIMYAVMFQDSPDV